MTNLTPPCPLCGHGAYAARSGLDRHLIRHHTHLTDRERSDVAHAWMQQGGRRR